MMIIKAKWLWGIMAALTICATACSKDAEPLSPSHTTNEQPEPWGDELPHGFYFDLDRISLPLTDDGFLRFRKWENGSTRYVDSIVMEKRFGYDRSTSKNGVVFGPLAVSGLTLMGKRATPFNNVDTYISMCRAIGVRPESKFNDFPELADLPVRKVFSRYTFFQLDTLVATEIITHTYFNKDCPAGGSMRGSLAKGNATDHPTYMGFATSSGSMYFDWWRTAENPQAPWMPEVSEFGIGTYSGETLRYMSCIMPTMDLTIVGYPENAGNYPMTLYMTFSSGKTISQDFWIRFVDEK